MFYKHIKQKYNMKLKVLLVLLLLAVLVLSGCSAAPAGKTSGDQPAGSNEGGSGNQVPTNPNNPFGTPPSLPG